MAERFADDSVQKSIALDLALIGFYDEQLGKVEWHCQKTAKVLDYQRRMLLRSVPGIGEILSLVILYEIHDIDRFPRIQDFVSYCRLVKCKKESAGKSYGTSGGKIGNAYLKWAFSEAAVLFQRKNPEAQAWVEKQANKHNKAKALSTNKPNIAKAIRIRMIWVMAALCYILNVSSNRKARLKTMRQIVLSLALMAYGLRL